MSRPVALALVLSGVLWGCGPVGLPLAGGGGVLVGPDGPVGGAGAVPQSSMTSDMCASYRELAASMGRLTPELRAQMAATGC